jgi:hypothetical protein
MKTYQKEGMIMTKRTMTLYRNDQLPDHGGGYYWEKGTLGGAWTPVTVKLPEGAKLFKNEAGRTVIELKNGHLCQHLFTDWRKDCVVPYLLDTGAGRRRILLDVIKKGGDDDAPR